MIGRSNRFHGHGSLRYVYTHGSVVRGPMLSLKYSLNPRRDSYRLAIVISKKVMKSAVKRNRTRRRLYETVRLLGPSMAEAYDLVITVFNDQILDVPAAELTKMVKAQFKQAQVLSPNGQKP